MKKILTLLMVLGILTALTAGPALIVNPANGASSISKKELKRILKGRVTELGGAKVVLITNGDAAVSDAFLNEYVGMDLAAFKKFWLERQIKGEGSAPMIKPNSAAVKAMVSQIPGAVSFVDESVVDASVKALPIQ
jgi:ABC-type phosphate transport system substrate-binding protein